MRKSATEGARIGKTPRLVIASSRALPTLLQSLRVPSAVQLPFSPLRCVGHVDVMAIGPACTAAAHAPHRPSPPDRPPSRSPPGADDPRRAGPPLASAPAGFALFGSGPAGSSSAGLTSPLSSMALFGS